MARNRRRSRGSAVTPEAAQLAAILANKPARYLLFFEGVAINYVNFRANPRRELRIYGKLLLLVGAMSLARLSTHSAEFLGAGFIAYAALIAAGLRWTRDLNTEEERIPGLTGRRLAKTLAAWLVVALVASVVVFLAVAAVLALIEVGPP